MELSCAAVDLETLRDLDLGLFDAVYLGHPYCLKTRGNLLVDDEAFAEAVGILKRSGKKVYASTPILPTVADFGRIEKYLALASDLSVDAVEVWDVGIWRYVRKNYEALPTHLASTMNIYQPETAIYYRDHGAARLVPANELLSAEVEEIVAALGANMEVALPIHGGLPLGYSYACMLRMRFPERELSACRQQCRQRHYLDMGDWRMRCVGTANVTAEDFSLIEHLDNLPDVAAFRLESHFDSAEKINDVATIYREAMAALADGRHETGRWFSALEKICGPLCNGWRFGLPGRAYQSSDAADPRTLAEERLGAGTLEEGVADAG